MSTVFNLGDSVADPEEYEAVEEQAREDAAADGGVYTYTHNFRAPFVYMGKTYTELRFDWDGLTGRDGLDIEAELQAIGTPVLAPEFSGGYQIRLAARACTESIGSDAFELMPLSACNRIRRAARSFLLTAE